MRKIVNLNSNLLGDFFGVHRYLVLRELFLANFWWDLLGGNFLGNLFGDLLGGTFSGDLFGNLLGVNFSGNHSGDFFPQFPMTSYVHDPLFIKNVLAKVIKSRTPYIYGPLFK